MFNRRILLGGAALGSIAAAAAAVFGLNRTQAGASPGKFEVTKSDEEWRRILTPEQYYVLRQHGTERAGTSPLNNEHRKGAFHCAGCDLPVYSSEAKFESGTGWPSFFQPLPNAVGTSVDSSLFMTRIEVHCRRCGGHLGHVFDDGPPPTGKRYCMNGVALKFRAAMA